MRKKFENYFHNKYCTDFPNNNNNNNNASTNESSTNNQTSISFKILPIRNRVKRRNKNALFEDKSSKNHF